LNWSLVHCHPKIF